MSKIEQQFKVNVFAPILLSQLYIQHRVKTGRSSSNFKGRIVNISSTAAQFAWPWQGAYSATKFAVEGFSDSIRREVFLSFFLSFFLFRPVCVCVCVCVFDVVECSIVDWFII
jgi:short-subunit dehydrogenase